ncbi:hypothetical protein BaRGS_00028607 [Batillaria attramentaria]|uniref:Uncharacterized protein n=1 Tax=Batillaria attramentaria TaxID=370345 RepID=A0ABD0JYZ9_9CAEN
MVSFNETLETVFQITISAEFYHQALRWKPQACLPPSHPDPLPPYPSPNLLPLLLVNVSAYTPTQPPLPTPTPFHPCYLFVPITEITLSPSPALD